MKKTVIRFAAVALCLIVALTSMVACDAIGDVLSRVQKVKKLEIPTEATYRFYDVNVIIEEHDGAEDVLAAIYKENYYVNVWDDAYKVTVNLDEIICKDGTIEFLHYYPLDNPVTLDGEKYYFDCESSTRTLGTYSGKDVSIDKSLAENERYTDAYLTEEGFVLCVDKNFEDGTALRYEVIFTAAE